MKGCLRLSMGQLARLADETSRDLSNEPYYCVIGRIYPAKRVRFYTRHRVTIAQEVWLFRDNTGTNLQSPTICRTYAVSDPAFGSPSTRSGAAVLYLLLCFGFCARRAQKPKHRYHFKF